MTSKSIASLMVILFASSMGNVTGTVLYNYGWIVDWDHIDLILYVDQKSLPSDWMSWDDVLITVNVTQAYNADRHEWVSNANLTQLGHIKPSSKYGGSAVVWWYDQLWFPWNNPSAITKIYFDPIKPRQV